MDTKGKNYLKVVGIIDIIIAVFGIIGIVGILAFSNTDVMKQAITQTGFNTPMLVVEGLDSIILLIAGITGIMYCNDPEHANVNLIMGGLVLLITIIGLIMTGKIGISSIISFILPALYLIGAYLNKKTDIAEFNEENNI